jgi:hypothetical protein
MFNVQKGLFQGLGNVECLLELAIDSMNIDNNIDKSDGRKKVSSNFKVSCTKFDYFLSYMFLFVSACYFILLTYISSSTK